MVWWSAFIYFSINLHFNWISICTWWFFFRFIPSMPSDSFLLQPPLCCCGTNFCSPRTIIESTGKLLVKALKPDCVCMCTRKLRSQKMLYNYIKRRGVGWPSGGWATPSTMKSKRKKQRICCWQKWIVLGCAEEALTGMKSAIVSKSFSFWKFISFRYGLKV